MTTRTEDITTTLHTLDPAAGLRVPAGPRARADLARILALDPQPSRRLPPPRLADRPGKTIRIPRRAALAGGLIATVTAAVVALPVLTGGDKAFASWTPTPAGMTATDRAAATDSCRRQQDAQGQYAADLDRAQPAIVDRRGVWTTVILTGPGGFSAMCITDDSTHWFDRDMIGSIGRSADHTAPGSRDLIPTDLGTGTMNAGDISIAAGIAGQAVTGVIYHSRTHGDVTATVSHGHFALWFPGNELTDADSIHGVDVEVTYRDGTTAAATLKL